MPRAIVYLRVSTDEQVESGAGLNGQRDACRRFADREGLEVVGPFQEVEGLSGATPLDRCPRLMDAVAELRAGDMLLVAKRDRLARDMMKILMFEALLKAKKCRLVSAAGEGTDLDPKDPMGMMMRRIVDVFAEFERLMIISRIVAALQAKRTRSERTGRIPYGFDLVDDGRRSKPSGRGGGGRPIKLERNPYQQAILAQMRAWRSQGWTYRHIAEELGRLGVTTKAGKPWSHCSVHYVLGSPHPLSDIDDQEVLAAAPGPDPGRPAP